MQKKIIVALDGCSSTGKSTMAKALAKALNYDYIDSGAMYRAVTLYALEQGIIINGEIDTEKLQSEIDAINIDFSHDEQGKPITLLNGRNVEALIRTPQISAMVSPISALPFVREALTQKQKEFGLRRGIVMDGRDIGTTVFPDAELKVFVVADANIRAQRRYDEMKLMGIDTSFDEVLHNLLERDRIDSSRAVSPLAKAHDAIEFDNSFLTIEEQNKQLLLLAEQAINRANRC